MLTVHGEADTLEDDGRPLHLKKFNVAWIGEPKLPLNELARTRWAAEVVQRACCRGACVWDQCIGRGPFDCV